MPPNVLGDPTVLGTSDGVTSYMARLYSEMPMEDFKYSPSGGYNNAYATFNWGSKSTGESLGRDWRQPNETNNCVNYNWVYSVIRDCNYFIQNFPGYASKFTAAQAQNWLGEAYFTRATCYYALVRRFGGVPLVTTVISYPSTAGDSIATVGLARASEADTWNLIATDLDSAYNKLPVSSQVSRADKSTAAAYKARAMLFAGCIAKYNTNISPANKYNTGQLCGFAPGTDPAPYFQAAYDAAKLVISGASGKTYSLYMKDWAAGNLTAQFRNMVDMFFDPASSENIFVRQYDTYLDDGHNYDLYMIPDPIRGWGWGSEVSPTLDFVEMFDGFPHWPSGTPGVAGMPNAFGSSRLQNLDASGNYMAYDNPTDLFANAEPRLKAYVITPFDVLKGSVVEIRAGIYVKPTGGTGLVKPSDIKNAGEGTPLNSRYDITNSASSSIFVGLGPAVTGSGNTNFSYTLPNGTKMLASGNAGIFPTGGGGWYSSSAFMGFSIRKYLNENKAPADMGSNNSYGHCNQTWIDIRYAEVLLSAAEAIMELNSLGQSGNTGEALQYVNQVQQRAGANITPVDSFDLNTVRKEWRKEFAFENKTWFNLLRWRLFDKEMNKTVYRQLTPFYVADAGKYIFDIKPFEEMTRYSNGYTWNTQWYYQGFPAAEVANNKKMVQNIGY
ncbi:MAG TPA: RagB/SusD family nutrient uptake outer membrane protein [Puia sp.]|nr:RagB/SusD family nutrient uptake outer membrane protein [Puia sp.]